MEENNKKAELYRLGMTILILLAFLTVGEFTIGRVAGRWAAVLIIIAFIKAFLIVRDYMHIGRLFSSDEEA